MTAACGLPPSPKSRLPTSSGGPCSHEAKAGDAIRPLSFMASARRSFSGKNVSTSNTPSLRMGGCWISPSSAARSRSRPSRHECSMRLASRMCSRLEIGSASIPTSPSRPETNPSISSRSASASSSNGTVGAASDPTMLSGTPASEPGVKIVKPADPRSRAIRSGPWSHDSRPVRHSSAVSAASSSTDFPSLRAWASSIHGAKSAGRSSGNVSSRLVMSPLGSRISVGMPASSASSR